MLSFQQTLEDELSRKVTHNGKMYFQTNETKHHCSCWMLHLPTSAWFCCTCAEETRGQKLISNTETTKTPLLNKPPHGTPALQACFKEDNLASVTASQLLSKAQWGKWYLWKIFSDLFPISTYPRPSLESTSGARRHGLFSVCSAKLPHWLTH